MQNYQVKLSQLDNRMDGSYHLPIVNEILKLLTKNAKEVTNILDKRISDTIIAAGVFKRIYVEKGNGIPFMGNREMLELNPSIEKFLSLPHHQARYEKELKVMENWLVIASRGTIGRIIIVPKQFENYAVSQNTIKVKPASEDIAGYLYSFLNTSYGQILIKRQTYGAVVDMVDDNNIGAVEIPLLKNKETQTEINALVLKANKLRYTAYEKEQKAIKRVNEMVIHATDEKLSMAAEPRVKYKNKQE